MLWLKMHDFKPYFAEEIDDLLVEYKQLEGLTKSQFESLVAAVEFVFLRWRSPPFRQSRRADSGCAGGRSPSDRAAGPTLDAPAVGALQTEPQG